MIAIMRKLQFYYKNKNENMTVMMINKKAILFHLQMANPNTMFPQIVFQSFVKADCNSFRSMDETTIFSQLMVMEHSAVSSGTVKLRSTKTFPETV